MSNFSAETDSKSLTTVGEVFSDGATLELVTLASSGRLALLSRGSGRKRIAAEIKHSHQTYRPPELDAVLLRALRFPHNARSYGSARKLFSRILEIFEMHAGLSQPESALLAAWAASSWFPDCLSSPPMLLISGPEMGYAITVFRLLHCVCRRPLMLGDLNRTAFLALAPLGATLLVNQPGLSPKIRALWSTSNFRGVHVFGSGRVNSVASSKAIFLGMTDAGDSDGVHLALPPARHDVTPLDEQRESQIADELQPQLLDYRLRNLGRVRDFTPRKLDSIFVSSEVARNLAAGVLGEPKIVDSLVPLLQRLDHDRIAQRGCDVDLAVIEVVWSPSHTDRELGISQLCERTNTLLRSRGEILEYSAGELGWKLRNFGFHRHRNGRGMVLQFTTENRRLIHQWATRLRLNLPQIAKCAMCSLGEVVDSKKVM